MEERLCWRKEWLSCRWANEMRWDELRREEKRRHETRLGQWWQGRDGRRVKLKKLWSLLLVLLFFAWRKRWCGAGVEKFRILWTGFARGAEGVSKWQCWQIPEYVFLSKHIWFCPPSCLFFVGCRKNWSFAFWVWGLLMNEDVMHFRHSSRKFFWRYILGSRSYLRTPLMSVKSYDCARLNWKTLSSKRFSSFPLLFVPWIF